MTRERRTERGSILILTALSMVSLLGMIALVLDGSRIYEERNRLSSAADAAVRSAALERRRDPNANLMAFANRELALHSIDPATTSVVLSSPPTTGPFAGRSGYLEATVSRTSATMFASILGVVSMTSTVRAVAGTTSSPYCMITLAPVGSSRYGLSLGNSTLSMPTCAIGVAGDLEGHNPNSTIAASAVTIGAGYCTGSCSKMGTVTVNAPPPLDPFEGQMAAISHGACAAAPATGIIPSGACYSILNVTGTRTLAAGTTYFTGPITLGNNATLTGSGVTLVLDNGASIAGGNHNTVRLSAPTTGTYPGVVIYQPASNTNPTALQNNSTVDLDGAVYMPTADFSAQNSFSSTSDCTLFVVRTFSIDNGNGAMSNACTTFGGSPALSVSLAE